MIWQKEFYRVISYCKDRPNRSERVTQTPAMREQNQKKVNMVTFRFLLFGLWSFCSQNKSISSFSLQYPISLFSFLLQPMSTLHKIFYKDENENQDCMRKLYFQVITISRIQCHVFHKRSIGMCRSTHLFYFFISGYDYYGWVIFYSLLIQAVTQRNDCITRKYLYEEVVMPAQQSF